MRSLMFLFPALMFAATLAAQTPAPAHKNAHKKTTPAATATHKSGGASVKNFKLTGSPSAPVTIEIYTDYECPACRALFLNVLPQLEREYVATGKVQLLHRDFPLPMHKYSKEAARLANAAGQIGQYQLASTQIFRTQPDWAQNGNVDAALTKVLSPADMQKVRELLKTDSHLDDTVVADQAMGNKDNLTETPTMIIVSKGKRQKISGSVEFPILKSYLDQMLAKG